ncbi:MAG: bacillithiol system redox-active protein YtxJ [Candidatus Hydrogenedentes bacterium]|nr:bacillithiol system redox-active protein YtxJ [Candidatus Hydrogenedentota bacterium]
MFKRLLTAIRVALFAWAETQPMPKGEVPVHDLTSLSELDACLVESEQRPVFIFKHSTACPISSEAYRQVAAYVAAAAPGDPPVYLVKVIEDRPVSNQIADVLGVVHKSPQIILVSSRATAWSASHYGVRAEKMKENAIPRPSA